MDMKYIRAIHGSTGLNHWKDTKIANLKRNVNKYFHRSSDYQYDTLRNGEPQEFIIYNGTTLDKKKIIARPNAEIHVGDIIDAYNAKWFVTTVDLNDQIYPKAECILCNCVIRWLSRRDGSIVERIGYAENAAKYATGVRDSNVFQEIEFQIKVKLPVDEETVTLRRDDRFLLDLDFYMPVINTSGSHPTAFMLSNSDVFTRRENFVGRPEKGAIEFIFAECAYNEVTDNPELMIADYYKNDRVYPKIEGACSIEYKGQAQIQLGKRAKVFTAKFDNTSANASWKLEGEADVIDKITMDINGDIVKLSAAEDFSLLGKVVTLVLTDSADTPTCEYKLPIVLKGVKSGGK